MHVEVELRNVEHEEEKLAEGKRQKRSDTRSDLETPSAICGGKDGQGNCKRGVW